MKLLLLTLKYRKTEQQQSDGEMRGPAADYDTLNTGTVGEQPQYEAIQLDQRRNAAARYANIQ